MAKRQTCFDLESRPDDYLYSLDIVNENGKPEVELSADGVRRGKIKDKDLERFAVNILKALKSKHLKP